LEISYKKLEIKVLNLALYEIDFNTIKNRIGGVVIGGTQRLGFSLTITEIENY